MKTSFLFTCEHASKALPGRFEAYFSGIDEHCRYDKGALSYAKVLSERLEADLFIGKQSRLLVDLNRSPGHRSLFSDPIKECPSSEKIRILERYYWPFRKEVFAVVSERIQKGEKVVHISCHSFVPEFKGRRREVDIGVLYDPSRNGEVSCAHSIVRGLRVLPIMVHCNAPYRGVSDGHVTSFRRQFSDEHYVGIELEVNQ